VTYARTDIYYDFTVDDYHNYVMAGVVHHNTGKTYMSMAACHVHAAGRPYRAVVMCPDHLVGKWKKGELEPTIPGAKVRIFKDWKEVWAWTHDPGTPTGPEWYILGRDQSKFLPKRRPAFAERVVGKSRHRFASCPSCGGLLVDREGAPIDPDGKRVPTRCDRVMHLDDRGGPTEPASGCGGPLWQFTNRPYRWAPAMLIHRRMRGLIDYCLLDELHEMKSSEAAQANAAGKLIASSRRVLGMTGTLIGGYANHLFPLLVRLDARSLRAEGLEWDRPGKFDERYGRIETTVTTRNGRADDDLGDGEALDQSMGKSRKSVRKAVRPGIMPTLFGRHLVDKAVFLGLEEVAEALPELVEQVIPVEMGPGLGEAYSTLEEAMRSRIRPMLMKGNKSKLGVLLQTLLGYPDHPYGFGPINFGDEGTVIPDQLDPTAIYPKERVLLDLCRRERALARQVWVYTTMTDKRDVAGRLCRLLQEDGLKATVLRSAVDRKEREDWIAREGKRHDVIISHPKLVETGLDLFSKDRRGHNFATLVFASTGFNLFTLRQAARRAWRIGQPMQCKVAYLYYEGTMQAQAMALMGKKLAAAEALEGKFSAEGLAAMGGEDSAEMALARGLADRVRDDAGRTWERTAGVARKALADARAADGMADLLGGLDIDVDALGDLLAAFDPA
jgi:hypothetical protein